MRTVGIVLIVVLAACSSSGAKTATKYPRSIPAGDVPTEVRSHLAKGEKVTELAPGVYKRASDGLILGKCTVVRPYGEAKGEPDGSICFP